MRGEDNRLILADLDVVGSPPHARGRPSNEEAFGAGIGITPACAGKTRTRFWISGLCRDHPRMRGEDISDNPSRIMIAGSPPHARGRQLDSPGNPAKSFSAYQFSFALNLVL